MTSAKKGKQISHISGQTVYRFYEQRGVEGVIELQNSVDVICGSPLRDAAASDVSLSYACFLAIRLCRIFHVE